MYYDNIEPLTGWPSQVLPELLRVVADLAEYPSVYTFYIGRTIDPNRRIRELATEGANELIPLYYSGSPKHAMAVEEELIAHFLDHPKNVNRGFSSWGPLLEEYGNYVYIAVRHRRRR